jgi:hypothetical protein
MWEAYCFLLLDYVRQPETRQQAACLACAKYNEHEDLL